MVDDAQVNVVSLLSIKKKLLLVCLKKNLFRQLDCQRKKTEQCRANKEEQTPLRQHNVALKSASKVCRKKKWRKVNILLRAVTFLFSMNFGSNSPSPGGGWRTEKHRRYPNVLQWSLNCIRNIKIKVR